MSAATVVLDCFVNILEELNKDLSEILSAGRVVPFSLVRKFAVDMLQLDSAEIMLYAAFDAQKDDIFYQEEDSADWQLLKAVTYQHEIENPEKYKS